MVIFFIWKGSFLQEFGTSTEDPASILRGSAAFGPQAVENPPASQNGPQVLFFHTKNLRILGTAYVPCNKIAGFDSDPIYFGLFYENTCYISTSCEVVQNMSGISQSNKDQNVIFLNLLSHGKFFLF